MEFLAAYQRMQKGYRYEEEGGVGFFRAASLCDEPGLAHGFTARKGGVSKPPFDSLNLGWSRDEPEDNIRQNYEILCRAARVEYKSLVLVSYEHGTAVQRVGKTDLGRGMGREPLPPCDGLVTDEAGVTLVTSHADCAALFLYDPVKRAAGLAHAGWRGVLGRMGQKMAQRMMQEYGCLPERLIAAVGPCICGRCFEVDETLGQEFQQEFSDAPLYVPGRQGKGYVDLEMACGSQFLAAGLKPENITLMNACTVERPEDFYSYRRDREKAGSMAAYLCMEA